MNKQKYFLLVSLLCLCFNSLKLKLVGLVFFCLFVCFGFLFFVLTGFLCVALTVLELDSVGLELCLPKAGIKGEPLCLAGNLVLRQKNSLAI